jgi:CubicO group peptidase (beta-lactamase class C family)
MLKLPRDLFAAAILIAASAVSLCAQTAPPPDLDSYVAKSMKTFDVPGMAVAIVKDGKVVIAKGYGVRKLGDPTPVDEHTMFGIGSNTKAFTTAALAGLVDAGKLSWDDPVYQRLPGFVMYDPYVSHEMTIRDLLTHRSGMGLGEGDLLFWPHSTYTREEIIYKLRFMKPASSFRSHYAYDNLLYMTAGQIIPAVTGTSWDDYIRQHIFAPLGMNNSNVSNTAFKPDDDYAFPHERVDGKLQVIPFEVLDNAGPAGAINSCAADMAKWVQLQLNRGKFIDRDGRLFSEQRSKEMWSPQTILPIGDPPPPLAGLKPNFADYALGWGLRDYHGRKRSRPHRRRGRLRFPGDAGAGRKSWRRSIDQCGGRRRVRRNSLSRARSLFWIAGHRLDRCVQVGKRHSGKRSRGSDEASGRRTRPRLQAFPAAGEICRRLQRRLVWPYHDPRRKPRPDHHLRSHAHHDR